VLCGETPGGAGERTCIVNDLHVKYASRVCRRSAGKGAAVGACQAGPLTAATCCLAAANGAGSATPVLWTYRTTCMHRRLSQSRRAASEAESYAVGSPFRGLLGFTAARRTCDTNAMTACRERVLLYMLLEMHKTRLSSSQIQPLV